MNESILNPEEEVVGRPPLEDMPMNRPVEGIITKVEYRIKMYLGKIAYMTDKETEEPIIDAEGNKIPLKEFNVEISIPEFKMPNGQARITWLSLGSSLGPNAKLTNFLGRLGIEVGGGVKAKEIIDLMAMKKLSFILGKKKPDSKYQIPILETLTEVK